MQKRRVLKSGSSSLADARRMEDVASKVTAAARIFSALAETSVDIIVQRASLVERGVSARG